MCRHLGGFGGGVHVAEALEGFDLDVVDTTGDDKVGLAQRNLVHRFFDADCGGGARADRVDHGAVAADKRLHGVGGHHVGQRFLQDVSLAFLADEAGDEHLVQRFHAANTGALGGGDEGRVDLLHELCRSEAGVDERVDGGDQVPGGHAVHAVGHLGGDAPLGRVEPVRHLASDGARQGGLLRHVCQGTGVAGHAPFAVDLADSGLLTVGFHVCKCFFFRGHGKRDVAVEVDLLKVDGALVGEEVLVRQRADAAACDDVVAEALVDVLFGNLRAIFVVPGRVRVFGPGDQAHHPRQFEDAGCSEVDLAGARDAVFGFAAGAPGAPAGYFADADDNHHVVQRAGDIAHARRCGLARGSDVWQCAHRGAIACRRLRARHINTCITRQIGDGHACVLEPASEVEIQRGLLRLLTGFLGDQAEQLRGDLLRAPHVNTCGLCRRDEAVVAAHQVRAGNPADAGLRQGDTFRPAGFRRPLVHNRVEGCLDLAVGAVATERAAVRRARQNDVSALGREVIAALRQVGQAGNGAFDRPQQQAGLRFGVATDLCERAGHRRCGEREGKRRGECRFDDLDVLADGFLLLGLDPVDECIDVAVGRQVRRHQPQARAHGSVLGEEGAGEFLARLADVGCGHDDRRTACEQAFHHCGGDGTRRGSGD